MFHEDGGVTFLDFGCVKEFGAAPLVRLRGIDDARRVLSYDRAQSGLAAMGVEAAGPVLRLWLDTLYEPLTAPQPFRYNEVFGRSLFDAYLGLLRDAERRSRLRMPKELLLMNRINLGVHSVLCGLRAAADWREELDRLLDTGRSGRRSGAGR